MGRRPSGSGADSSLLETWRRGEKFGGGCLSPTSSLIYGFPGPPCPSTPCIDPVSQASPCHWPLPQALGPESQLRPCSLTVPPSSTDIRETAFVFAITAAGASHAVTQACSMGELLQCGCQAPRGRAPPRPSGLPGTPGPPAPAGSPDASAAWEWGGCGDDVDFGDEKSRLFMDARHKRGRGDIRALVQLHNNEAGRLVCMGGECACR